VLYKNTILRQFYPEFKDYSEMILVDIGNMCDTVWDVGIRPVKTWGTCI